MKYTPPKFVWCVFVFFLIKCPPLAAAIADVGFLSGVLPDVGDERAGLGEGLTTDKTEAGLLSCKTSITVSLEWDVQINVQAVCFKYMVSYLLYIHETIGSLIFSPPFMQFLYC